MKSWQKPQIIDNYKGATEEISPGLWAIAKPHWDKNVPLSIRLQHAWEVLRGRATAVVFARDARKRLESKSTTEPTP